MSRCKSCDAPIRWVRTTAGRSMPLNRDPDPAGNVVTEGRDTALLLTAAMTVTPGTVLYTSHFATCPNAEEHRR